MLLMSVNQRKDAEEWIMVISLGRAARLKVLDISGHW